MRAYTYDILDLIKRRWSPRAFSTEALDKEEVYALLEAASYAPSAFNEQPWRFIIGIDDSLQDLQSLLLESNLLWAKKAPVLILWLCKKTYTHNQKDNAYCRFDSGTAWGFLSLEATKRGLYTHAMAGFRKKKARELLSIPEDYEPLAMIAIGKPGRLEDLDLSLQEREKQGQRKDIKELIINPWSE